MCMRVLWGANRAPSRENSTSLPAVTPGPAGARARSIASIHRTVLGIGIQKWSVTRHVARPRAEGDMVRIIHETPNRVQARHCAEDGYIIFDWSSFAISLDEIRTLHEESLAAVVKERCLFYIADTSKVRDVFAQEVIEWWGHTWVPKLREAGLLAIVTVVPSSELAALSTRSWQAEVQDGISMLNTPNLANALGAIKILQMTHGRR